MASLSNTIHLEDLFTKYGYEVYDNLRPHMETRCQSEPKFPPMMLFASESTPGLDESILDTQYPTLRTKTYEAEEIIPDDEACILWSNVELLIEKARMCRRARIKMPEFLNLRCDAKQRCWDCVFHPEYLDAYKKALH